jgi:hypothetical protein
MVQPESRVNRDHTYVVGRSQEIGSGPFQPLRIVGALKVTMRLPVIAGYDDKAKNRSSGAPQLKGVELHSDSPTEDRFASLPHSTLGVHPRSRF